MRLKFAATLLIALASSLGTAPPTAGMAGTTADAGAVDEFGPQPASAASSASTVTLVGAGDIASCSSGADSKSAALIKSIPGIVFTAGDNVYPYGSAANYAKCYGPTWGAFKKRTRPVVGNHDYEHNPAAYFAYFGARAGQPGRGYYAYDVGTWRVYALNSELDPPSTAFTQQYDWLENDLAANPTQCVIAIWHRPEFSTGPHGDSARMSRFFQLLYDNGAEIVINGHDHMYERYTPIDPAGTADPTRGIREFVVGTGGASLYAYKTSSPLVVVRNNTSHGVLKLTLSSGSYAWQFIPSTGTFTDSGTATCH